ncbi:MAG TPA: SpoIID/LytB domain-containing protein [Acidimicrobiia bacterium]|nr:SpoIID/LytB domain-containing protein [Acidimicrobiia bacterium]
MRLRFSVAVMAFLVAVPVLVPALPAQAAEDDFTVDGGGWGHGVGMSQYGAFGMALREGKSAEDIIGHFYSGATVSEAQGLTGVPSWIFGEEALAVNVASKRTELDFEVRAGEVSVCHRGDGANPDDCSGEADTKVLPSQSLRVLFDAETGGCVRSVVGAGGEILVDSEVPGECWIDVVWDDGFSGQAVSTLVDVEELAYARGPFQLRPNTTGPTFDVTVRLGLEEYLYGIAEVPLGWPTETLRAQVLTARSYAVSVAAARGGADGTGRLADCGCHIRRTTADQKYDAWDVEGAGTLGAAWRAAVDATTGEVVTHPAVDGGSTIVRTYYSSSTGGITENVEDVWGGEAMPHLKSVEDRWGGDPAINPLATWRVSIPETVVRARLCELGHCWERVSGSSVVSQPPGAVIRFQGLVGRQLFSADIPAVRLYNWLNARDNRVSPYITGVLAPSPFIDIDTSVHRNDIIYIADLGVTKGCNPPENSLFCPVAPVTRQQMASFLVRALELPKATADHFTDDTGSVHEADINALAEAGVTKGCNPPDNTRFCPKRPVTRGEMAAFLVRAYAYTDDGGGDHFIDDDSSVFERDIDLLATAGVTKGCNPPDNTRYCPGDSVTREQMASFLARAIRDAVG